MIEAVKVFLKKHLKPRNEPVVTAYVASVLVRLALRFGFGVDEAALSEVLEPFIAAAFFAARQFVSPVRPEDPPEEQGF